MFWGHLNKKQRVKQCRPSEVFKLNDWCIQFHEFNSLKETTQYLVWDKEGEEDTEDHVMNQLFQAADTSDDKNNDRGKSRGMSRDRRGSKRVKNKKKDKAKAKKKKQSKRKGRKVSSSSSVSDRSSSKSSSSSSSSSKSDDSESEEASGLISVTVVILSLNSCVDQHM